MNLLICKFFTPHRTRMSDRNFDAIDWKHSFEDDNIFYFRHVDNIITCISDKSINMISDKFNNFNLPQFAIELDNK